MPSLTVVIPTYNDSGYLAESARSVLKQNWPGEIEILIIDDGSTPPASETFSPPSKNVRIHRQENLGVSAARNTGIQMARGDYIAFLDADDLMLPARLERQIALMESHSEIALVGGDVTRRGLDGDEKSWGIFEAFGEPIAAKDLGDGAFLFSEGFRDQVLLHYPFNTSVVTVRRSALEAPSGLEFDPKMICWEDWDFVARMARRGRIGYIRRPITLYRKREGSITTTPDPRKFLSRAHMFERFGDLPDLDPSLRKSILQAEAESLLTASWEYRSSDHRRAFSFAFHAFRRRPGVKTLKALLGAIVRFS